MPPTQATQAVHPFSPALRPATPGSGQNPLFGGSGAVPAGQQIPGVIQNPAAQPVNTQNIQQGGAGIAAPVVAPNVQLSTQMMPPPPAPVNVPTSAVQQQAAATAQLSVPAGIAAPQPQVGNVPVAQAGGLGVTVNPPPAAALSFPPSAISGSTSSSALMGAPTAAGMQNVPPFVSQSEE